MTVLERYCAVHRALVRMEVPEDDRETYYCDLAGVTAMLWHAVAEDVVVTGSLAENVAAYWKLRL
jgi:hypothetical protein